MKKLLFEIKSWAILLLLLSAVYLEAQDKASRNTEDLNPKLIAQISDLTERYNKHRIKTSEIFKKHGYGSQQMAENEHLIAAADEQNRKKAKAIFDQYGFPTFSEVGTEKAHEYWIIVQNCNLDTEFQLAVLKIMDKLIHKGEADARDYAYLSDRVRINLGMKQVYGTQVRYNDLKKTYEPYELNKPEEVDERRATLKLDKMASYIQTMNKKYEGTLKRKDKSIRLVKKP